MHNFATLSLFSPFPPVDSIFWRSVFQQNYLKIELIREKKRGWRAGRGGTSLSLFVIAINFLLAFDTRRQMPTQLYKFEQKYLLTAQPFQQCPFVILHAVLTQRISLSNDSWANDSRVLFPVDTHKSVGEKKKKKRVGLYWKLMNTGEGGEKGKLKTRRNQIIRRLRNQILSLFPLPPPPRNSKSSL